MGFSPCGDIITWFQNEVSMVRVRLSRGGGKKRPYYHIVVVDQKSKRDGKCIERIGSYDPNLENEKRITLKQDRLEYWLNQGAQMSDRVKLLHKYALDPDNLEKRHKIKTQILEKNRIKKQKAKESEEAPAEAKAEEAPAEAKAEETPTEEALTEEAPAEAKAEETPTEEAPAEAKAEEAPADDAKAEEVTVDAANADEADAQKEKS